MAKWIFVRCRMRANRPEFTTDDWQVVVKEVQRYADSKPTTGKKHYPIGPLDYRVLGDRLVSCRRFGSFGAWSASGRIAAESGVTPSAHRP